MTWFKVDDGLWGHPKWLSLAKRPRARALWVTAGSWCAANLQDGFVPAHVLGILGGNANDAAALVEARLWEVAPGGWKFHEWDEPGRQPTRVRVESERRATAERVARWRERHAGQPADEPESNGVTNAAPDPTRPDPTIKNNPPDPSGQVPPLAAAESAMLLSEPTTSGTEVPDQSRQQKPSAARSGSTARAAVPSGDQRGTRVPDDFTPTPAMLTWVRAHCPEVPAAEHERFMDYWRGVSGSRGVKRDWVATWRNWMRTAADDIRKGKRPAAGPRRSTTDERVAAGLALAAKYDAEDGTATVHQLPIGGTA